MTSNQTPMSILIVGAGPVGLLTSLRLAQRGIKITVLEGLPAVEQSPRAAAFHAIAVRELDRAGVLGDCRKIGGSGKGVCWRKTYNEEIIVQMQRPASPPKEEYEHLIIGQHELAAVIQDHLEKIEGAEIKWCSKVVRIDKNISEGVTVTTESPEGKTQSYSADYLVGADGGRSSIRKLCDISFDGFTYPEQLVACNVYYPFDTYGWLDANFLVDPDHWALVCKLTEMDTKGKGLWRVSYGEKAGLTHEEVEERLPWKFSKMFPGPQPPKFKLDRMSPYRLNQRCASTFRKERIILAGDAAHLCNPFGGLGLCGGLLDAGALADALIAISQGEATDEILDFYAESRRTIFLEVVDPFSQANKERLHTTNPDTVGETDPFLRSLREMDPNAEPRNAATPPMSTDINQFLQQKRSAVAVH